VHANHDFETIDVPVSQGSTRIVYAPLVDLKSGVDGCASGENMRRKLASAFKCLTVSDMADWGRDQSGQAPPPEATKQSGHYLLVFCSARLLSWTWVPSLDGLRRVEHLQNEESEAEMEAFAPRAHTALWVWCWPCMHKCVISPISRDGRLSPRLFLPTWRLWDSKVSFDWGCNLRSLVGICGAGPTPGGLYNKDSKPFLDRPA
jgi:hypothetical protein